MMVHGDPDPHVVPADVLFNGSDTLANRKVSGHAGHSSKTCPCPICKIALKDINERASWEIESHEYSLVRLA